MAAIYFSVLFLLSTHLKLLAFSNLRKFFLHFLLFLHANFIYLKLFNILWPLNRCNSNCLMKCTICMTYLAILTFLKLIKVPQFLIWMQGTRDLTVTDKYFRLLLALSHFISAILWCYDMFNTGFSFLCHFLITK